MSYTIIRPVIVDLSELEQIAIEDLPKPKETTAITEVADEIKDITEEV